MPRTFAMNATHEVTKRLKAAHRDEWEALMDQVYAEAGKVRRRDVGEARAKGELDRIQEKFPHLLEGEK